jgi:predicted DNA-binding transcriptional regulator AlpA
MNMEPQQNDLKDITEMARILKVRKCWLYGQTRQRGKGTIPHLRLGKYLRFQPEDVIAWAAQRAAER